MLAAADRVEGFIKALRERAVELLQTGSPDAPTRYKLIPRQGNRAWSDAAAVEKKLRGNFKVDEVFNKKVISPAQAQKLCKAAEKTRLWEQKLYPLVSRADKGTNMVPITHPTPAIEPMRAVPELTAAVEEGAQQ